LYVNERRAGLDRVALTFYGDGTTNVGPVHESLNLAAAWNVGVVFIIENNLKAADTPVRETTALEDLAERARAHAIPGVVDGQDVAAAHAAVMGLSTGRLPAMGCRCLR